MCTVHIHFLLRCTYKSVLNPYADGVFYVTEHFISAYMVLDTNYVKLFIGIFCRIWKEIY
jgi:hypothetical protein